MHEPSPFQGGEPTPPPPAMPKPAPPQGLGNGLLPRASIEAMPLPVPTIPGTPKPEVAAPLKNSPSPITPVSPPPAPAETPTQVAAPSTASSSPFAASPPPPASDAPLIADPHVEPIENEPIVPRKKPEASFKNVEEEALQKAPFSWGFRTALIGMSLCIPVFLMLLFGSNFNFLGFSLSLILIGLLCGLAFRFFSKPWSFPITSLFTALFTMALAEALLTTQIGARAAALDPFPYFIAVITINPLDLIMETMTHMMTSARGLIVGLIAAFWLGYNN